ncbi:hypothetical protein P3S67_018212 [Capsicum chacoense]
MDALSKVYARMSHNFSILIFLDYLNNPLLYSFQCFSSSILHLSMDKYFQGLFFLANDPTPEVRKLEKCSDKI